MARRITDSKELIERARKMLPAGIPAEAIKDADYEAGNGYWIYLADGYICPEMECHTIHEDTLRELAYMIGTVEVWADDPNLETDEQDADEAQETALSEEGQAMKIYIYERLKTPEIKTSRVWDADDVRRMCIKHDFYACGDNEDYSAMLRFVDEHEPTTEALYIVAVDIYEHSALDDFGQYGDSVISSIMFDLEREAVRTFYEIEED